MKITKIVTAVALVMGVASAASAAEPTHDAFGRIKALDAKQHNVTIGHQRYRYDPHLMGANLRPGERVHIIYRERNGQRYAIQILPGA